MLALCIDLGGTEIKLGILVGSDILAARTLPSTGQPADLVAVRTIALGMLAEVSGSGLAAVGVAVPGVIDHRRRGLVAAQDKYGYLTGMDIVAWAEAEFGAPAILENDARAALVGEVEFGIARGERDAVLLTLGTGIGTAAIIEGQLLRGSHDHAGILGGHITVDLDGPDCNCGNVGCAEAVASTWALDRDVRTTPELAESPAWSGRLAGGSIGIKDLLDNQQDAASHEILARFVRAWGAAIVGLCHAYDPQVVIVSGGVMRSASAILPQLTSYVHAHLWSSSFRPELVTPSAPENSVLLGLSALAARNAGAATSTERTDRDDN